MSAASPSTSRKPSARERLLTAADELFYAEGIHTVGIDRVIERAGVAKASLYHAFGSKDDLIRAYLEGRARERQDRFAAILARHTEPRARLLAVFDLLNELAVEPGYRGCAFVNATAESKPGGGISTVSDRYRGWVHSVLTDLAREAGAAEPERLAMKLRLLYDGAMISTHMDHRPEAASEAKALAELLLDSSL